MTIEQITELKKVRLKTISPIHIGGELNKITKFEFIFDGSFVYPISEERLSSFLMDKNLVDDYVQEIEIKERNFNLLDFLKTKKINLSEEEKLFISNGRKIKASVNIYSMIEFHPLIRDGFSKPYIPGTSIKGVIRTAILYFYLKKIKAHNYNKFKNYIENFEKKISDRSNKKEFDEFIIQDVFQNFNLNNKNKSPNTDWLRMLKVSDAYPINLKETFIIPINILKKETNDLQLKKENNNQLTTIWTECYLPNTFFEFNIIWDKKLQSEFGETRFLPTSIDQVFNILSDWSKDIIEFEKNFASSNPLSKWYDNKDLNFRIGFGSGMVSTTIAILLEEELRKKIRNYAGLNRGSAEAPKSRRIWQNNNNFIPLGWAYIEKEPFQKINETQINENNINSNSNTQNISTTTPSITQEIVTIENATLTWRPQDSMLFAEGNGIKAQIKLGADKSIVPEPLHKRLFGNKNAKAKVTVKKEGNLCKIIKIEV